MSGLQAEGSGTIPVLFLESLSANATEGRLHGLFSIFGTVLSASIFRDINNNSSLGMACIYFENSADCQKAASYVKMLHSCGLPDVVSRGHDDELTWHDGIPKDKADEKQITEADDLIAFSETSSLHESDAEIRKTDLEELKEVFRKKEETVPSLGKDILRMEVEDDEVIIRIKMDRFRNLDMGIGNLSTGNLDGEGDGSRKSEEQPDCIVKYDDDEYHSDDCYPDPDDCLSHYVGNRHEKCGTGNPADEPVMQMNNNAVSETIHEEPGPEISSSSTRHTSQPEHSMIDAAKKEDETSDLTSKEGQPVEIEGFKEDQKQTHSAIDTITTGDRNEDRNLPGNTRSFGDENQEKRLLEEHNAQEIREEKESEPARELTNDHEGGQPSTCNASCIGDAEKQKKQEAFDTSEISLCDKQPVQATATTLAKEGCKSTKVGSKVDLGESKVDPGESKVDQSEFKVHQGESQIDQDESKEDQTESKEDQTESKEDQAKFKEDLAESKVDQDESKVDQAKSQVDKVESKVHQDECKEDQAESKVHQGESRIDQDESKVDQAKSQVDKVKSKVDQVDSKEDEAESKVDQAESEVDQTESKEDQAESLVDQAESQVNQAESQVDQAKSKVNQAESKLDQDESKVDQAESQVDKVESKVDQVDSKEDQSESQVDQDESQVDQDESKVDQAKFKVDQAESKVDQAESKGEAEGNATSDLNRCPDPHRPVSISTTGNRKSKEQRNIKTAIKRRNRKRNDWN